MTPPPFRAACPRCGHNPQPLLAGRRELEEALSFLRDGKTGAFHLLAPSVECVSGALHALDWALGDGPGAQFFAEYLAGLTIVRLKGTYAAGRRA